MSAGKVERPWKVRGGPPPSAEAVVRACLVLLGKPPVIPAHVLDRMRREQAAKKGGKR